MNKTFLILAATLSVILIKTSNAQSIETYHGNTIKPDSSYPVKPRSAKQISTDKSKSIELNSSHQIEIQQGKTVQLEPGKQIDIERAKNISTYKSKEIEPYHSKEIEVYKGNTSQPDRANKISADNSETFTGSRLSETQTGNTKNNNQNSDPESKKKELNAQSFSIDRLYGVWHTKVPGAVWQTPSGLDGYNNLHVSAGARSGDLVINKNGTYSWNSYGGKKGKWKKGDSEYPIVLIDNVEKKEWKVGIDSKHTGGRDIIIWDGNYFYYDGKK